MTPDISIILPVFNAARCVDRAVQSALEQNGVSVEVVAVDDCSTDNTVQLLERRATQDARIRVFRHRENLGPSSARNLAIEHARGTWLAILDADDALTPDSLLRLSRLGDETRADIVAGAFRYFDFHAGEISGPAFDEGRPASLLSLTDYVSGSRPFLSEPDLGLLQPLIRARFLRSGGYRYPTDVRHGEDFRFIFDLLDGGARYVFARDILSYLYTTRASGLSQTRIDYGEMIRSMQALARAFRADGRPDVARALAGRVEALHLLEVTRSGDVAGDFRQRIRMYGKALQTRSGRRWMKDRLATRLG